MIDGFENLFMIRKPKAKIQKAIQYKLHEQLCVIILHVINYLTKLNDTVIENINSHISQVFGQTNVDTINNAIINDNIDDVMKTDIVLDKDKTQTQIRRSLKSEELKKVNIINLKRTNLSVVVEIEKLQTLQDNMLIKVNFYKIIPMALIIEQQNCCSIQ
jgi:hypothetical protein